MKNSPHSDSLQALRSSQERIAEVRVAIVEPHTDKATTNRNNDPSFLPSFLPTVPMTTTTPSEALVPPPLGTDKPTGSNQKAMDVDAQLHSLLSEAGLEQVPMDPSSLEALKELIANDMSLSLQEEKKDSDGYNTSNSNTSIASGSNDAPPPPISEVVASRGILKRATSELTQPGGFATMSPMTPMRTISVDDDTTAATAGSSSRYNDYKDDFATPVKGASPVESKIMEQLNMQTALLLNMQQRIDELTYTVAQLQQGGGGGAGAAQQGRPPTASTNTTATAFRSTTNQQAAPHITTTAPFVDVPRGQTAAPTHLPPANNNININNRQAAPQPAAPRGIFGLPSAIRNSRIAKILALFLALRRRHVQALDPGLIFKVLFMIAVLMARMSNNSIRRGGPDAVGDMWATNFAIVSTLVLVGFFIQTGYLKYLYIFCIKENYPGRIWNGEDITAQQLQQQQQQQQQQQNAGAGRNNNNNNNNDGAAPPPEENQQPGDPQQPPLPQGAPAPQDRGWRDTFIGGGIPQHVEAEDGVEAEGEGGGVMALVQDVGLLLGSFVLSIFPMWEPEAVPRPGAPAAGGGVVGAARNHDAGPGQVRPPENAMQPADDDEDDEDEDGDGGDGEDGEN